jgi:hypothetical protein
MGDFCRGTADDPLVLRPPYTLLWRSCGTPVGARPKCGGCTTGVLKRGHARASGLSVLFLLRQRYGMDANSVANKQQWQRVCHGPGARQRRGMVPAIHPDKQRQWRAGERDGGRMVGPIP